MDPRAVARVVERISNPPKVHPELKALSPQEARILDLIAEGQTNRQIAESMFLSEKTVKNYVTGLLGKLKMNSRTEAAIYATKLKSGGSQPSVRPETLAPGGRGRPGRCRRAASSCSRRVPLRPRVVKVGDTRPRCRVSVHRADERPVVCHLDGQRL